MAKCSITFEELKPGLQAYRRRQGIFIGCQAPGSVWFGGRLLCGNHYNRELKKVSVHGK